MTTTLTSITARISCAAILALTGLSACAPTASSAEPAATPPAATATVTKTAATKTATVHPGASTAASTRAATTSPATHKPARNRLAFNGLRDFQLGVTADSLLKKGLIVPSEICENSWEPSAKARKLGVTQLDWSRKDASSPFVLASVMVDSVKVRTAEGARIHMTYAEFEKIYGAKFAYEQKKSQYGDGYLMGRVREGDREILLYPVGEGIYDATPTTKVMYMEVRFYDDALGHEDAC